MEIVIFLLFLLLCYRWKWESENNKKKSFQHTKDLFICFSKMREKKGKQREPKHKKLLFPYFRLGECLLVYCWLVGRVG